MINKHAPATAAVLMSLIFLPLVFACSDDRHPIQHPMVTLVSISVVPATFTVMKGRGIQFTANGVYSDDTMKELSEGIVWTTDDPSIATISETGLAAGLNAGTTTIRANKDELMGAATLTVMGAPLVSITLSPTTLDLLIGDTSTITARGMLDDDTELDLTNAVEWISSDPAIATVSGGVVHALASGTVNIDARDPASMISTQNGGSVVVTIREVWPTIILVRPESVMIAQGLTQQFTATGVFPDQSMRDITADVMWISTQEMIATVSNTAGSLGVATGLAPGISSIEARHVASGVHASATLRVLPPAVARIDVTPSAPTIGRGQQQTFLATATYTDGAMRDLSASVIWSSSDESVAVLNAAQRATFNGIGAGITTIKALDPTSNISSEQTMSSATLTVTPPTVTSIAVLPQNNELALGLNQQYTAYAVLSDNTSSDVTAQVTWASSAPNVASVDAAGFVTTLNPGFTTIVATDPQTLINSDLSGLSGQLTVDPAQLLSISVAPPARAMIISGTQQFTATGHYTDGTGVDLTNAVIWQSSGPAVTINAVGFATAQVVGTVSIDAIDPLTGINSSFSGQSASVTVSDATLLSIQVTPTTTSAPAGAAIRFVATGTYDNMATADLTNAVTWNSSSPATVDVSNDVGTRGRGTARANGSATISAVEPLSGVNSDTSGGSATFNVINDTLLSLAVNPRTADVALNRTRQFTALGTFTSGNHFDLTNGVTWNSSNTGLATISNVAGSQGVATGVVIGGPLTISALHVASNISSNDSAQSATVQVIQGIVTLSGTYTGPNPPMDIDGTANYGVNFGSVVFAPGQFPAAAVVSDVNISINFLKTDGSCSFPATGFAYHNETNFALLGPTGVQVILALPVTWNGGTATSAVVVSFDQQAAAIPVSTTPVSGTFLPNGGTLDSFTGTNPSGTWILQAGDTAGADPLCVYSYTVTVTAQ